MHLGKKRSIVLLGLALSVVLAVLSISALANPRTLINRPAPKFQAKDIDGFQVSLETGAVTLIDFWATWCGPCHNLTPHIRSMHEKHMESGLGVVGVVVGDRLAEVRKYVSEHRIRYPNIIDTGSIARAYGVTGIPALVLVDRAGVVRFAQVGFAPGPQGDTIIAELDKTIADLLAR